MGYNYTRSVRCSLPLWALMLEAVLIFLFFFFTSYDGSSKDQKRLMGTYRVFQDITIMAALGLGFLTSYLRRHGWSSVAFNLFMLALGVQWAILLDGFLSQPFNRNMHISPDSIQLATMSAMSVLISLGAVLGKVNLVQLMVMVLVELTVFGSMRMVCKQILNMDNHTIMMQVHVFAAYFGLTVSGCFSSPLSKEAKENYQPATSPSLFAMLGTLFLWIFWPSFNSALLDVPSDKKKAVFNTYYALATSAVTAISVSASAHPQGKINMIHIHNAVLAGGVVVGTPGHLIISPWIAMVLGLLAGLISIGGANCLPVSCHRVLGIHDSCGMHYTFALPGLLGGITNVVLRMLKVSWTKDLMISYQVLHDTGGLSLIVATGLAFGFLTGFLLRLKIWKPPHAAKYFDDQAFWKFPHLAVGF
ncbi:PREDICTED: RH-like protein isoform X1 [Chrysochloris asiatica]|uniref:RH-like protein isoform X1 n=1 Tax=Chrysochloris asiatica TaxID=185453 RepID=A0A9B0TE13_CHRAS|nr:PREDICTED: RH-like protein isoform X1 [Chrysochloris asiatica]